MPKIGKSYRLPIAKEEVRVGGKKKEFVPVYADGRCVYIHPKNRFAVFDFGTFRQCFTFQEIASQGG